jgi:hypothetical protein
MPYVWLAYAHFFAGCLLRESFREQGRVRKRTLANLSAWPTPLSRAFAPSWRAASLSPRTGSASAGPCHTAAGAFLGTQPGNHITGFWQDNFIHVPGADNYATKRLCVKGKTFKGMTDEMLAWQTAELQNLATGGDAYTVHVQPKLVAEIAFNGIQASPRYPAGLPTLCLCQGATGRTSERRMPTRSTLFAASISGS